MALTTKRPGKACWTCRLRRKRCDTRLPRCGACQNLGIYCYAQDNKPAWLDGGVKQAEMSEVIKKEIKQNALNQKRKRSLAYQEIMTFTVSSPQALSTDPISVPMPDISGIVNHSHKQITNGSSVDSSIFEGLDKMSNASAASGSTGHEQSRAPISTKLPQLLNRPEALSDTSLGPLSVTPGLVSPIQMNLGSIMTYLDYTFPFLFPFYRPTLLQTGRQWLLGLLCQNEVSFHIAAGLSAYFFLLVPEKHDQEDIHEDCKALVLHELYSQMDTAFQTIQKNLTALDGLEIEQTSPLRKIRMMEEIIQLLVVELSVRQVVEWNVHLIPALTLLDEIFETHGMVKARPSLRILLNTPPLPLAMSVAHHKPLPNTPDQAALVFFVTLLLFIDIIASTSLGTTPVLQKYHQSLLLDPGDKGTPEVDLEAVTGCQNWVFIAISRISGLCEWKQSDQFSKSQLTKRAALIAKALEDGLRRIEISGTFNKDVQPSSSSWSPRAYYNRCDAAVESNTVTVNVTRIWAYAAKLYLITSTKSEWQAESVEIRGCITELLYLCQSMNSPARLRSLSWPITIAGCLASTSQQKDIVRKLFIAMDSLIEFGTLSLAKRTIETVWKCDWTGAGGITACLNILGSPVLLI